MKLKFNALIVVILIAWLIQFVAIGIVFDGNNNDYAYFQRENYE